MIFVTGGAGFIGSNFVLDWLGQPGEGVINLDKLTYAGNLDNLAALKDDRRHRFVRGDICDGAAVRALLEQHRPRAIVHFAAESHVDRSIHGPAEFITTNINGTFALLDAARGYWEGLAAGEKDSFRFLHISTDEVYGSLEPGAPPFTETTAYAPNSPYSASKASSDHLVRAWRHTYGLPTLTVNCSNNYGPFQFPEKLIPLVIANALAGQPLPVYGDGAQVRDWLYVGDHCAAIRRVLEGGVPGEVYNVGGGNETANIDVVRKLCGLLDEAAPKPGGSYSAQIAFVPDRPGHDRRYAVDTAKIARELGWRPVETFDTGLRKTVQWYLGHQSWVSAIRSGAYQDWIAQNYANREAR